MRATQSGIAFWFPRIGFELGSRHCLSSSPDGKWTFTFNPRDATSRINTGEVMTFSFRTAIAAAVRNQLSSLKSQTKRLHKSSSRVFGVEQTIDVCREAIAVANGFRNWVEVQNLSNSLGRDNSAPFWTIYDRNPHHEAYLEALWQSDIEMSESRPVIVLGKVEHAVDPAVCLWAEEISARKVPGVVVVDTDQVTLQKTHLWSAVKRLGLAEMFQRFRVIDARDVSIPLAITANARAWCDAIVGAMSPEDRKVLQDSNVDVHFENLLQWYGAQRAHDEKNGFDSYVVDQALLYLRDPSVLNTEDMADESYLKRHFKEDAPKFPKEAIKRLSDLGRGVCEIVSGVGILLRSEARHRPTVVLCDSNKPTSIAIANLVRDMYYSEFITARAIRPFLFCSITSPEALPHMIHFGNETVLVTGETSSGSPLWNTYATRSPAFVTAYGDEIQVSGKAISIETSTTETGIATK